jgi:voltage-gated potassium channel Kch
MKDAGRASVRPQGQWGRFTGIWATEVGLSVFTGLLALEIFVVSPLANLGVLGTGLIDVVFTLLLICGVLALHPGRILRVLVVIFVGIAIGLRWTAVWHPMAWIVGAGSFLAVVTFGCFATIVLTRVFETGPVTRHRVHGAVCAYLLFGLMWAAAYAFIEHAFPQAFNVASVAGIADNLASRFVYFSFVTLTTVGYGDITAVHPLARTLVIAEALTGQLFPAIIIGGLVSSALQSRSEF